MDKKYWEGRQEQTYLAGEKEVNSYYRGLKKSFEQSKKEIQLVINDFYAKYADNNNVSFAMAQKLLSKSEVGELKDFIARVNETMGEYDQELVNMSIKARITRYEALQKQIDATLQKLYAIEYQYSGKEMLKDLYTGTYYRNWYSTDVYTGFHAEFAQINPSTIDALIAYPFNGSNFSTRIWKQKDHMLQQLGESITTMIIQGKNPKTLSGDFAKKFKTKEYEAYRLLHTEGSFIMGQSTLAAYGESGVEKYDYLATLDSKTSELCREADGKTHKIEDAVVGVNYPPLHNFCRSTTTPHYDDEGYSEDTRVARDSEGKTYKVPASMNYKQWHDKYVTSETEKQYNKLIGVTTSNNIKITGISDHLIDRAVERGITYDNSKDALINPLKLGKIKQRENGNSQEYFGADARVIINPDTGNIITVWKTSTKLRNKLEGGK